MSEDEARSVPTLGTANDSTTYKQNRLSNPGNREPVLRRIVYGRTVNFAVCTSDCPLTRSRTRTSIE